LGNGFADNLLLVLVRGGKPGVILSGLYCANNYALSGVAFISTTESIQLTRGLFRRLCRLLPIASKRIDNTNENIGPKLIVKNMLIGKGRTIKNYNGNKTSLTSIAPERGRQAVCNSRSHGHAR
jgi:hypothetical protein